MPRSRAPCKSTVTMKRSGSRPMFADRHQNTRAFEWLDRAYRQKEPVVEYIKVTRDFDNLKGDPRYKAFMDKMHLPD